VPVKLIVPFEIDLPIVPFVGRVHFEGRRVVDLQSMVVSSLVEIGSRLGQAGVKRRGNGTRVTVARSVWGAEETASFLGRDLEESQTASFIWSLGWRHVFTVFLPILGLGQRMKQ
jgi:hypothetical protein